MSELYPLHRQIERIFKRLKTILTSRNLCVKDPQLAKIYLFSKTLGALFMGDQTDRNEYLSLGGIRKEHQEIEAPPAG